VEIRSDGFGTELLHIEELAVGIGGAKFLRQVVAVRMPHAILGLNAASPVMTMPVSGEGVRRGKAFAFGQRLSSVLSAPALGS
jgi:hypothetical protein